MRGEERRKFAVMASVDYSSRMRKAAYPFILVLILTAAFPLTATPRQDNVYAVGDGVSAPLAVKNVQPDYTSEAREARVQGEVVLGAVVTTDGAVTDIKVVQSLGHGLDESAVNAFSQWQFKPGAKDGKSVNVRISVKFGFNLR